MKTTALVCLLFSFTVGIIMTASAQDIDRTIKPTAQSVPKVSLPQIQKATLPNGLQILLVEDHELPVIAFNLVMQTGSAADPKGKSGLASMTAELLDEGTKTRDALAIAEQMDFIGASISVGSSYDATFMSMSTLSKHLETALELFADVLVNPTFPQKEFDRIQEQRLTALLQQKDRVPTIASLAFNKIVYSADHPYGNDASGSDQSIKALTVEDIRSFYNTYYRPNTSTLIVVGDTKLGALKNQLNELLDGWKSQTLPGIEMPKTPVVEERRLYLIDKPAAAQSEIRIGMPATARNTPDYFPLVFANRVLGGQFTSRLNLNLREKHGYTYGARSGIQFNKYPGPFVASSGVFTAKTDSSLLEFISEIDHLRADGITGEELDFVKKGLTGSFALSFETPSQIAGRLQDVVLYGLPERYYEMYLENVNNVSLEDVKRVCSKYFDSSRMAIVVAGDMAQTKTGIAKLNLGEIVMCDIEGNKLTQ